MPLSGFDPLIQQWFAEHFLSPTEPQLLGWPEIAAGSDTLISAPTGSGKTLAAFLICLDRLVRAARTQTLPDETQVVYVSPLKALSNDVHRNLEVATRATRRSGRTEWRPAHANSDGGANRRYAHARARADAEIAAAHSGHDARIAVYPADCREIARKCCERVSTVIVDEIHAMADDKRGSHLCFRSRGWTR